MVPEAVVPQQQHNRESSSEKHESSESHSGQQQIQESQSGQQLSLEGSSGGHQSNSNSRQQSHESNSNKRQQSQQQQLLSGWLEVAEGGLARPGSALTLVARIRRPEGGTVRLASCSLEATQGGHTLGQITDRYTVYRRLKCSCGVTCVLFSCGLQAKFQNLYQF